MTSGQTLTAKDAQSLLEFDTGAELESKVRYSLAALGDWENEMRVRPEFGVPGWSNLVLLLLAAAMLSAAGCNRTSGTAGTQTDKQSKRIIMLINGDDPFWDAMRCGM